MLMFSPIFFSIPLKHLIQWTIDEHGLEFCLRKTKNDNGEYENIQDLFINNMIHRPVKLEGSNLCELTACYEMKKYDRLFLIRMILMINTMLKVALCAT